MVASYWRARAGLQGLGHDAQHCSPHEALDGRSRLGIPVVVWRTLAREAQPRDWTSHSAIGHRETFENSFG